jgi:hypothetical protein
MQGEAYIAEPRPGDPHPFPAVRGLGSCRDVGQGGVQLGQFQAPFSSRVEIPARDGFVQEPLSFAVVIWTVHSVLFGRRSIHPWPGPEAYVDLTRSRRQRFSVRVPGSCHGLRSRANGLGRMLRGRQLTLVRPACWQAEPMTEVITWVTFGGLAAGHRAAVSGFG